MKTISALLFASLCIGTNTVKVNAQEPTVNTTVTPSINNTNGTDFNYTTPTNGSSTLEFGVVDMLISWGFSATSEDFYTGLSEDQCGVCLTTDRGHSHTVKMDFIDSTGEDNWNHERFSSGRDKQCTTEVVDDELFERLKVLPDDDDGYCLCNIYVACNEFKAGFGNAWASYDFEMLKDIWLKEWPEGHPSKDGCPSDCIKIDDSGIGAKGLTILSSALKCSEDDRECKIKNAEIWD